MSFSEMSSRESFRLLRRDLLRRFYSSQFGRVRRGSALNFWFRCKTPGFEMGRFRFGSSFSAAGVGFLINLA
jgi:hypothetical protein